VEKIKMITPDQDYPEILVIGYGNTLRSDDGIGQEIAEEVAKWHNPKVRSLLLHQLTPELAPEMAQAKKVIFVDAIEKAGEIREIELRNVTAMEEKQGFTHQGNPQSLLYLTQQLYQKFPQVWWLLIPGVNFDFGEDFSAIAIQGMEKALTIIKKLIAD
jgi:hydrogenase maturation protease